MPILAQINATHIDLGELINASKVLDAMQKTRLLVLATKLSQEEKINLYNALNAEKEQLSILNANYQRMLDRYENQADEFDADAREKAEAEKIMERLNNL